MKKYEPAVKFANKNYFTGGIFPIGKVGINTPTDGKLDKNQFDDIATDTLSY